MLNKLKKTSKGFSLLELLLVVAVGAVLILAGLGAYRLVTTNAQTNDLKRQLVQIKAETQRVHQSQGSYTGLTTATGVAAGIFNGIKGGNAPQTPFNSRFFISVGASATRFNVTMQNLPASACADVATMFVGNPDFVAASVTNGAAESKVNGTKTTAADIRATCVAAQNSNDLVMTFQ